MDVVIDYNIVDTDYVRDGVLYVGTWYTGNVLLESVNDLTGISALNRYMPGALAHTAGWALAWELGNDGSTWTAM